MEKRLGRGPAAAVARQMLRQCDAHYDECDDDGHVDRHHGEPDVQQFFAFGGSSARSAKYAISPPMMLSVIGRTYTIGFAALPVYSCGPRAPCPYKACLPRAARRGRPQAAAAAPSCAGADPEGPSGAGGGGRRCSLLRHGRQGRIVGAVCHIPAKGGGGTQAPPRAGIARWRRPTLYTAPR